MNSTNYIVGGSKGMGLETAKRLASRGESITLIARGSDGLSAANR